MTVSKEQRHDSLHRLGFQLDREGDHPDSNDKEDDLLIVPERLRGAVQKYGGLFVNRRDMYAWQKKDGSYICVRKPLTYRLLWRHLEGRTTLGVYSLDQNNRGKWLALDADDDREWAIVMRTADRLSGKGIPSYLEQSRRGGHLWLFFEQPLAGTAIRAFGREILGWEGTVDMEMFPKRDENQGGPGSLIRLPLGIHRRDGKRYLFLQQDGGLLGESVEQQLVALVDVRRVSSLAVAETLGNALSGAPCGVRQSSRGKREEGRDGLVETLKQLDLYDFVSGYMELTPSGRGHCPFHDDEHISFSVNRKGNYWNCFAGCGGGDIIHFWERWQGVSRGEAIRQLAEMTDLKPGTATDENVKLVSRSTLRG